MNEDTGRVRLLNAALFENISESELAQLIPCLAAESKRFEAGQLICDYGEGGSRIGIMQSGTAVVERFETTGNRTILEYLQENSIFGEVLVFSSLTRDNLSVVCEKDCCVLFMDYEHLTKRCEKACAHHSVLVQNLLRLIADRAVRLSERLDVLSHRSIREKLLCCFSIAAAKDGGGSSFLLPFSFTQLADYICADRSAMMREIKKLKEEGLIKIDKRRVTLYNPYECRVVRFDEAAFSKEKITS